MSIMRIYKENRQIFYMISGTLVTTLFFSIFWFLNASLLTKEIYGILSFIISLSALLSTFSIFGFTYASLTYNSSGELKDKLEVFNVLVFIFYIISNIILLILKQNPLISFIVLGYCCFHMHSNNLIVMQKYYDYAKYRLCCCFLMCLFGTISVLLEFSSLIISLSFIAPTLFLSTSFWKNLNLKKFLNDIFKLKTIYLNLIFLGIYSLLRNSVSYLDKVIISFWFGFLDLADYNFIFQIFLVLNFIPQSIQNYLISEYSRNNVKISNIKMIILLSILVLFLSILFAPLIIKFLFPLYSNTINTVQLISISIPFSSLGTINISNLINEKKVQSVIIIFLSAIFFQYFSIYYFYQKFNLFGLGISLLLTQILIYLLSCIFIKLHSKKVM